MSSFLSLPLPTIGEFACLFFDIYFSTVENSRSEAVQFTLFHPYFVMSYAELSVLVSVLVSAKIQFLVGILVSVLVSVAVLFNIFVLIDHHLQ
jgi:hypothetical protein